MKRQYLGDSKDSFKWDYLHFVVPAIGFCRLQIVWMMTPDDNSRDGGTPPELFPARSEILKFCNSLRKTHDPEMLSRLPTKTNEHYVVSLHKTDQYLENGNRESYFSGIDCRDNQVVFLDPDNGFEPECRSSEKHVLYSDIERIVKAIPPSSVVTVFQHFNFRKFSDNFARIRQRLHSGYYAAIFRHPVMFVSVSSSPETIKRVCSANREYAKHRPVEILV